MMCCESILSVYQQLEVPARFRYELHVHFFNEPEWFLCLGKTLQYLYMSTSVLQEELKKTTLMMVEQSKVLNTPGAEKQTKRELFDALRQELE